MAESGANHSTPPVKEEREGTEPRWRCPECGARISPGYEETSEGIIKADGTWSCHRCGYFYDKKKA